jgi:hypothetical protein
MTKPTSKGRRASLRGTTFVRRRFLRRPYLPVSNVATSLVASPFMATRRIRNAVCWLSSVTGAPGRFYWGAFAPLLPAALGSCPVGRLSAGFTPATRSLLLRTHRDLPVEAIPIELRKSARFCQSPAAAIVSRCTSADSCAIRIVSSTISPGISTSVVVINPWNSPPVFTSSTV